MLLTLALSNDTVVQQLLPFLPPQYQKYAPIIGILWGAFVQAARSYKQKTANAPAA